MLQEKRASGLSPLSVACDIRLSARQRGLHRLSAKACAFASRPGRFIRIRATSLVCESPCSSLRKLFILRAGRYRFYSGPAPKTRALACLKPRLSCERPLAGERNFLSRPSCEERLPTVARPTPSVRLCFRRFKGFPSASSKALKAGRGVGAA